MTATPHAANGSGPAAGRGWTARLIWSTVFLAMVLEALGLGASMVAIGLPSILKEFPTTQGGWLTTVYFLAGAVCAPLLGKAADLYGKRRVLLVTMFVSGIGAVVCALAPSFAVMVVGRTLQGPILATISLIPSLIRDVYPPRQAAFAASITITGMGALSLFSPLLIGWLIEAVGFRGMFWFDAVWTFGLCAAIGLTTPESTLRRTARPDVLGAALLAAGVLGVLLYVSWSNSWGWGAARGLALLAGGAVLLALFFWRTRRTPEPIVNLSLFRRKQLLYVSVAGATAYAISASVFQVIPMLAMTPRVAGHTYGLGLSTLGYASIETPKALATVACGMLVGLLAARGRNPRVFMTLGLLAWAVGTTLLAYRNGSFGDLLVCSLIVGVGGGLTTAAVPGLVMRATPVGDQGSTAGTVQLTQTGFSAVLPVVMFAVLAPYATLMPGGGVVYAEEGFRDWLLISTALALGVLLVVVSLLRESPDRAVEEFTVDEPTPAADGAVTAARAGTPKP
ncbi:major facilitator superfamily MFS_1 [Actinobacteria bacterium OK074]|nr:major facilitator superfamily MFS_1 [Actinobacteria bacterium OK074]